MTTKMLDPGVQSPQCSVKCSTRSPRETCMYMGADLLLRICRWPARRSEEPAARSPPDVLRAAVSGVFTANDVELVERVHQRFQKPRSSSAVQGYGQAGRVSPSCRRNQGLARSGPSSRTGTACFSTFLKGCLIGIGAAVIEAIRQPPTALTSCQVSLPRFSAFPSILKTKSK